MMVENTAVNDELQRLIVNIEPQTKAAYIGAAEAMNILPHLHKSDCCALPFVLFLESR
jgi:hypothetical protein